MIVQKKGEKSIGGKRLSARNYYDTYGASSIGDICEVSGKMKCLQLKANGSPHWTTKLDGCESNCRKSPTPN